MRVSLNWLKNYTDICLDPEKVSEVLTEIGLEVEGMETCDAVPGGLRGFVIGEVLTCERFEVKEKKLSLCTVDIGADTPSQIVCGASNVDRRQKVVVATIGTTLYNADGSPLFQISSKKTYGHLSEGMICAEDEIGIGHSHDGILILDTNLPNGTPAGEYFKLESDIVFEVGLTPNRSDATSHIGVAKDLAAALKINYGHTGTVHLPSVEDFVVKNTENSVSVKVENSLSCPRYAGIVISGIEVKESPEWLKSKLTSIGVNTRNNIVDITNFVMHELGQPLHAFDLNQISGKEIRVKNLPEGTAFTTLKKNEQGENVTVKLSAEDLMICDGLDKPLCIAGVIGSPDSGVSENTTAIFLESAHFNPMSTRRSGTRHNTRTDSSKIFEKGSDPNSCVYALKRASLLIQKLAGGQVSSAITDIYPDPIEPRRIPVSFRNIKRLLGEEIPVASILEILSALGIGIDNVDKDGLTAIVPTNKADVLREVDVIEEILRIYGFNKVAIPRQVKSTISESTKPNPVQIRNMASAQLAAMGFHEAMSLSLSQSAYYTESGISKNELVYIANSINQHLDIMRPKMLFSGLEAIAHNQNRQNPDLKLFEFGKTYLKKEGSYSESNHLAIFLTGKKKPESWLEKDSDATYYTLKGIVEALLARLGLSNYQVSEAKNDDFSYALQIHRGPQIWVQFGKIKGSLTKMMDIRQTVYYADFHWDALLNALKKSATVFREPSKFPSVRRDLALVIDEKTHFEEIRMIAQKTAKDLLKEVNLFDVFQDENKLGAGKKSYAVSFVFEDSNKTLSDKDIDQIMNPLMKQYEEKLGALIRR